MRKEEAMSTKTTLIHTVAVMLGCLVLAATGPMALANAAALYSPIGRAVIQSQSSWMPNECPNGLIITGTCAGPRGSDYRYVSFQKVIRWEGPHRDSAGKWYYQAILTGETGWYKQYLSNNRIVPLPKNTTSTTPRKNTDPAVYSQVLQTITNRRNAVSKINEKHDYWIAEYSRQGNSDRVQRHRNYKNQNLRQLYEGNVKLINEAHKKILTAKYSGLLVSLRNLNAELARQYQK